MSSSTADGTVRHGKVFLHWMLAERHGITVPAWNGSWEREPDGPPEMLEESPVFVSLAEALAWSGAHARRTFIHLDDSGTVWHAGDALDGDDDSMIAGTIALRPPTN